MARAVQLGRALHNSTTVYHSLGHNVDRDLSSEDVVKVRAGSAATLSGLTAWVFANTWTQTTTLGVRKNGANGNQTLSVANATTGTFTDTSNSDSISVGDEFNLITTSAAGSNSWDSRCFCFINGSTGLTQILSRAVGNFTTASTTLYLTPGGAGGGTTSEVNNSIRLSYTATARHLYIQISTNTRSTTSTVRDRKNTANGGMSISVTAGSTGTFEDASNTTSLASADTYALAITHGTLTGNFVTERIGVTLDSTDEGIFTGNIASDGATGTGTLYIQVLGCNASASAAWNASETNMDIVFGAHTLTNFRIYISTNSRNGATTANVRQNQTTNTALSVSIGSSTTGSFLDADSISIGVSDSINYRLVVGGTSGTLIVRAFQTEYTFPSLSPSSSPSQSPSASLSPSISPSPSPSQSPSASLSPSISPSSSPSQSPSASLSPSISPSPSPSQSPSASLSPSLSPSISPSQSPSASLSPSVSPSPSPSQSPSASFSPSLSPSPSPSQSPSASLSPSLSPSPSPSVSPSPSPSQSPSASFSPSLSPSSSPSQSPSASLSPSLSPSPSPSQSPSASLSSSASPSSSPSQSPSSSISPSLSPSPSPSISPSASPSEVSSESPSVSPSASPSEEIRAGGTLTPLVYYPATLKRFNGERWIPALLKSEGHRIINLKVYYNNGWKLVDIRGGQMWYN